MNFFKRATTSVSRRPSKTVILLLLVFILGTVMAGAISVRGAINQTDANLRRQMPPIVSIGFDPESWDSYESNHAYEVDWITTFPPSPPKITPAHVHAIGNLPYVDFYDYMIGALLNSFELEGYLPEYVEIPEYVSIDEGEEGVPVQVKVRGSSHTSLTQIEQGIINLVPGGRQFTEQELSPGAERSVMLISQGIADMNNLTVGSVVELYLFVHVPNADVWEVAEFYADENVYERISMEFEVIGLFEMPFDPQRDDPSDWTRVEALNTFYVPSWVIEDMLRRQIASQFSALEYFDMEDPFFLHRHEDGEPNISALPLFRLENPADIEAFRAAAEPLLPDFHQIEDLSNTFDVIASSMESMQLIADWVLYVSIGAVLLILSLLITLFLRERRYEIGIYLALGEKKRKMITQILLEVMVTSVIGITLAVFMGHFVSGGISQHMLRNELVAQLETNAASWSGNWQREISIFDEIGIPINEMSVDEMMDAFDVSLSVETVGLFYAVGLGTVVLATLIPIGYVVKLSPKKVLM